MEKIKYEMVTSVYLTEEGFRDVKRNVCSMAGKEDQELTLKQFMEKRLKINDDVVQAIVEIRRISNLN